MIPLELEFEWDEAKNETNKKIRKIAFEDAIYAFADVERGEHKAHHIGSKGKQKGTEALLWLLSDRR